MKESDDELMTRCKDGDVSAFDLIVQRYKSTLINFVYRFLNNRDAAEDLTQEVFIRVYKNIKSYKSDTYGFKAWIYKIAANLCKNELRNRSRRSNVLVNIAEENLIEDIQDESLSPDQRLEQEELQVFLAHAIASLPEKMRIVLILRDIEGMSYEEISRIIKKPIGTVKSRLNRARLMLKDKMKGYV